MGEVIEFPGHGESGINKALAYFTSVYRKAGLTDPEISAAVLELEPIIREFLVRREFVFELNGSFTEIQVQLISDAHNEAMQAAIKYFSERIWLALCNIAGLIGRGVQRA